MYPPSFQRPRIHPSSNLACVHTVGWVEVNRGIFPRRYVYAFAQTVPHTGTHTKASLDLHRVSRPRHQHRSRCLCSRVLPVRAKDTINQLKEEISNLSKLVEKGAGLSVGQENMVKELIRVRDELTRKTDEQGQTIAVGGCSEIGYPMQTDWMERKRSKTSLWWNAKKMETPCKLRQQQLSIDAFFVRKRILRCMPVPDRSAPVVVSSPCAACQAPRLAFRVMVCLFIYK